MKILATAMRAYAEFWWFVISGALTGFLFGLGIFGANELVRSIFHRGILS